MPPKKKKRREVAGTPSQKGRKQRKKVRRNYSERPDIRGEKQPQQPHHMVQEKEEPGVVGRSGRKGSGIQESGCDLINPRASTPRERRRIGAGNPV